MLPFEKDRFALAGVRQEHASILLGGFDAVVSLVMTRISSGLMNSCVGTFLIAAANGLSLP